jgi:hypothetical protein
MAKKFRKAILKTGTYHSPDGTVEVTPERLRNWELQFGRMSRSNQVVPIDWDHADTPEALQPLSMDAYHKRRSAQTTIGHLADFRVSDSGDSAEITLDLRTPKAVEAAELNTVYVSPVLFPEWKDGAGNTYRDVITHVDMVNHPVDHSQTPFVPVEPGAIACALRMSLNTKPYRLSEDPMEDDDKKPDDEETPEADDSETPADKPEPDDKPEESTEPMNQTSIDDVIEGLKTFNIVLPDGTNGANFLERVHAALLTAAAHQGKGPQDQAPEKPADTKIEDPMVATMSLQARAAMSWAESQHRKDLAARLKRLSESGRCTPAELKARDGQVTAVKLSLDASGQPSPSDLEKWLESREVIPAGTFWTDEQRTMQRMSHVHEPPAAMNGELTPEQAKQVADWALGRK